MNLEEVEITIQKNGRLRIQTRGFSGEHCLIATRNLEAALGNALISREMTSESLQKPPKQEIAESKQIRHA